MVGESFSTVFMSPAPRNKWGRFQPRITHWSRWIRRGSCTPRCHRAVRPQRFLGGESARESIRLASYRTLLIWLVTVSHSYDWVNAFNAVISGFFYKLWNDNDWKGYFVNVIVLNNSVCWIYRKTMELLKI